MGKINFRQLHKKAVTQWVLPLFITASTGAIYRLGKSWFGLSRDQVHFVMVIHEGEYLGHFLEPIYVLLNFLGVFFMLITGEKMLWQSFKNSGWFRKSEARTQEGGSQELE